MIGSRNSQPTGRPSAEHLEQQLARHPQAGVDVAGAVEVRIVDQPLPAGRRPRLLEVDAHRHAAGRRAAGSAARSAARRTRGWPRRRGRCRGRRRRAGDRPRRRGRRAPRAPARAARRRARRVERQLLEQRARRHQRLQPLDPLVADRVAARRCRCAHAQLERPPGLGADTPCRASRGRGPQRARRSRRTGRRAAAARPSQIASSGRGWTSTIIPSAPDRGGGQRQRHHQSRRPAAWLGSTITGRWVICLSTGTPQVEREAVGGLERADPALAQDHASLPSLSTYSAADQQLLERARQSALEQHGPPRGRPRSAGRSSACCGRRSGSRRRPRAPARGPGRP